MSGSKVFLLACLKNINCGKWTARRSWMALGYFIKSTELWEMVNCTVSYQVQQCGNSDTI